MLTRILAYALLILGTLVELFFRHYVGELIPHPWLFWLVGLTLQGVGAILLRNTLPPRLATAHKKLLATVADLKANGQRLTVDLCSCEVRTHDEESQAVFIYRLDNPRTGQTERFFSPVIAKDRVSLSFYLENQKTTTLYVDKTDRSRYYFDLDFLVTD